jgi:hypothetical protein
MPNFIEDGSTPFGSISGSVFPKTNLSPLLVPAANGVQDVDWNTYGQSLLDVRNWIRGGKWLAMTEQAADPAPSGLGGIGQPGYIWIKQSDHSLHIHTNGSDSVVGGGGGGGTLQAAYNAGGAGPQLIVLDPTKLGIVIQDNVAPIGDTLFAVQADSGTTYLRTLADLTVIGNAFDGGFPSEQAFTGCAVGSLRTLAGNGDEYAGMDLSFDTTINNALANCHVYALFTGGRTDAGTGDSALAMYGVFSRPDFNMGSGSSADILYGVHTAPRPVSNGLDRTYIRVAGCNAEPTAFNQNTITNMVGYRAQLQMPSNGNGAPAITSAYSAWVETPVIHDFGSPYITNLYGLKIEDHLSGGVNIPGVSNTWAIFTGSGLVHFGDDVEWVGIPKWDNASNIQSTVGAAGGASALPALPAKYLKVRDSAGGTFVVPAYNP